MMQSWNNLLDCRYVLRENILVFGGVKRKRDAIELNRVKLPNGIGSNFKRKVADNDSNITALKSHDCHIMMQQLLPVGVLGFLDRTISTVYLQTISMVKISCIFFKLHQEKVYTQREVDDMMRNRDAINNANFGILYDTLKRANIDVPNFQPFASPMNANEDNEDDDNTREDD
ncbi:hypothetical protein OSB04_010548 [Centaurea solstitialis]|uniref:Uncharacterized protein n=1 Tax=Centaurea solstitialis TaxID=347529 RepID=A0AA38WN97_9ASTR|nr:hypothetical protein OSB04_010548 [Centaurea solstitialis]